MESTSVKLEIKKLLETLRLYIMEINHERHSKRSFGTKRMILYIGDFLQVSQCLVKDYLNHTKSFSMFQVGFKEDLLC